MGVVLAPDCRYGPWQRSTMDWYMPHAVYTRLQHRHHQWQQHGKQQQQHEQQQRQQQQQRQNGRNHLDEIAPVPVVLFCHGGVWASGEPWHFAPMAARVAQAGIVVAIIGYTLYPDAHAADMAAEVRVQYDHAQQASGMSRSVACCPGMQVASTQPCAIAHCHGNHCRLQQRGSAVVDHVLLKP